MSDVRLAVGQPPARPGRRARHRISVPVILAYLGAALVVTTEPQLVAMPRWLALHLLFLGAATNAIVVYSEHFGETLLHARPTPGRWHLLRLLVLNAGVAAVLVGVDTHQHPAVFAGAGLVVAVTGTGAGRLARLARRSLAGQLRPVVWCYVTATGFLLAGAASGSLLARGHAGQGRQASYLEIFHAHVNLFGWVGLSVLGTLFMLWPAALRTRMAANAPTAARRSLAVCGAGLTLAVAALLTRHPLLAAAGMSGYTLGVSLSLDPFVRALRHRRPRSAAAAHLAAATAWLLAASIWDVIALAGASRQVNEVTDRLVPALALGLVAQVLVGALSFLVPALLGGGPAGAKRAAGLLDRYWPVRVAATNLGLLLALAPTPAAARTCGYLLAIVGLSSFLPLAVAALKGSPGRQMTLPLVPGEHDAS